LNSLIFGTFRILGDIDLLTNYGEVEVDLLEVRAGGGDSLVIVFRVFGRLLMKFLFIGE
jgi:hypothetical protein